MATLLSNLPGMAYRCLNDENRTMEFASEGCLALVGYKPEEITGEGFSYSGIIFPEDREAVVREINLALLDKRAFRLSYRIVTLAGKIKWVWEQSQEVLLPDGSSRLEGFITDITDRKLEEAALQEANEQLEYKVEVRTQELTALNEELEAMNTQLLDSNSSLEIEISERKKAEERLESLNKELSKVIEEMKTMQSYLVQSEKMAALGGLVAGIAHEINTPVGVGLTAATNLQKITKDFADLCENGKPRRQDLTDYLEDLLESANIIEANLERAAKLIRSFKQVSIDQSSEERREFNVKAYLEEILLSMHPKLKKTKLAVTVDCDEELKLDGFPGAFSQIITNLLMNSIIHAYEPGDEGEIKISAKTQDGFFMLTYSDDGKGMPKEMQMKIFTPFFTTKRGTGSTGLGLYILHNIVVKQFNGSVECDSEPGKGTSFTIKFPLKG